MGRPDRILALLVLALLGAPAVAGTVRSAWSDEGRRPVFEFEDLQIQESSGLVVRADTVVTVNDSGDRGRVFVVDRTSGRTVGVTTWPVEPEDVEALAPAGPGHVWVADIGDNRGVRSSVSLFQVPVGSGTRSVEPAYTTLRYPGGPVDAETLLVSPRTGRLFIVTKRLAGGELYAVPRPGARRPQLLRPVGQVAPIVTDGAFLPGGRQLVLRTYSAALVYSFPGLDLLGRVELPDQQQGEGLAVSRESGRTWLWVSSEGPRQPVYRVELPARLVAGSTAPRAPGADDPSAGDPPRSASWWPWAVGAAALAVGAGWWRRSSRGASGRAGTAR